MKPSTDWSHAWNITHLIRLIMCSVVRVFAFVLVQSTLKVDLACYWSKRTVPLRLQCNWLVSMDWLLHITFFFDCRKPSLIALCHKEFRFLINIFLLSPFILTILFAQKFLCILSIVLLLVSIKSIPYLLSSSKQKVATIVVLRLFMQPMRPNEIISTHFFFGFLYFFCETT